MAKIRRVVRTIATQMHLIPKQDSDRLSFHTRVRYQFLFRASSLSNSLIMPCPNVVDTTLFGTLPEIIHDTYHCEDEYDTPAQVRLFFTLVGNFGRPLMCMALQDPFCSHTPNRQSKWLELLLARSKAGRLPFKMPAPGSQVVDLGCGFGQDTRNLASLGKYAAVGVDVAPKAIAKAKALSDGMQIEFITYDALALKAPTKSIDLLIDTTVYCALRHRYLPRLYEMWGKLMASETLLMVQCWKQEDAGYRHEDKTPDTVLESDMVADFEPMFDVILHEECTHTQDLDAKDENGAWCFFLRLKSDHGGQTEGAPKEDSAADPFAAAFGAAAAKPTAKKTESADAELSEDREVAELIARLAAKVAVSPSGLTALIGRLRKDAAAVAEGLQMQKVSELLIKAREAGLPKAVLDEAMDADEPKAVLIAELAPLLAASAPNCAAEASGSSDCTSTGVVEAALSQKKLSALVIQAREAGVPKSAMDEALDADVPRTALTALIVPLLATC